MGKRQDIRTSWAQAWSCQSNSPKKLTRIYVVQVNPITSSGSLYLDELTITTATYPVIDKNQIPEDTLPVYEANKNVKPSKDDDYKKFILFGNKDTANTLLENLYFDNRSFNPDLLPSLQDTNV